MMPQQVKLGGSSIKLAGGEKRIKRVIEYLKAYAHIVLTRTGSGHIKAVNILTAESQIIPSTPGGSSYEERKHMGRARRLVENRNVTTGEALPILPDKTSER